MKTQLKTAHMKEHKTNNNQNHTEEEHNQEARGTKQRARAGNVQKKKKKDIRLKT